MPVVGIATVSRIAADAGARMADEGGNAVDAAVAAAIVSAITHPGMCSLGGGGFLTIWPPGARPVTVDGGMEMPGRGQPAERFGGGAIPVHLEYAGGVDTVAGPGSVATPGAVAACAMALERFGRLSWSAALAPAVERAERGFPLPAASREYLGFAHQKIFGWQEESASVLHDARGRLRPAGATIRPEGLADTLRALADGGPDVFYRGEIGRRIAAAVQERGGLLGEEDLAAYEARARPALEVELDGWRLATNPPPAIGGVALAAMLRLMGDRPRGAWTPADLRRLVAAQRRVFAFRRRHLDASEDRVREAERLLRQIAAGRGPEAHGGGGPEVDSWGGPGGGGGYGPEAHGWGGPKAHGEGGPEGGLYGLDAHGGCGPLSSASTLHSSAVDSDGLACSVTLSDGYGSGLMPPGTGFWLNNCLGEAELNGRGYHGWPPGTRLPSNMAPTAGRTSDGSDGSQGSVLAIGSPGADRITTAILETLLAWVRLGLPLQEAVLHPRLHVERTDRGARIACEPGLPVEELGLPCRRFERLSMFFGGVEAAAWEPGGGFELAADPRRTGGTAVGGSRQ